MSKTITLRMFKDLKIGERFFLTKQAREYKKVSGNEAMRTSGGPCERIGYDHAVMVEVRS